MARSRSILPHGKEAGTAEADDPEHLQDRKQSVWLGTLDAPDGATAMEKASAEFKVPADRPIVRHVDAHSRSHRQVL
jgi:hypothetical protein